MLRSRAATAAHQIEPSFFGPVPQGPAEIFGTHVVAAKFIGQTGIGVGKSGERRKARQFFNKRTHLLRPKGTVDAYRDKVGVGDRGKKSLKGLAGKRAPAPVRNRHGGQDRQANSALLEELGDGKEAGFQIQRIKSGLRQEKIHSPIHQAADLIVVSLNQLVEGHGPKGRVVDVGREGGGPVGRANGAGDEARLVRRPPSHPVDGLARDSGRSDIQCVGFGFEPVVGE